MRNFDAVQRIEGRLHEFIYTNDNRRVSLVSVAGAHLPALTVVRDMQYEQKVKGRLIVKVVEYKDKPITESQKIEIKHSFLNNNGKNLKGLPSDWTWLFELTLPF